MKNKIQTTGTKRMGRKILYTVLTICCFLSACSMDDTFTGKTTTEEAANVIFSLEIPGKNTAATRAMSEKEENAVRDVDVLVFNAAENEDEKLFLYAAYAKGVTTDQDDQSKKTFTVTLATGTFDIVVLANVRDSYTLSDLSGLTKEEVQRLLRMDNTTPWNATSENDFRAIPMWGEKKNVTIDESTRLTGENSIKLLRMLAKVNVMNQDPGSDFILEQVYIYNPTTSGLAIPAKDNLTEITKDGSTYIKATAPSLPAGITPAATPWTYTDHTDENNNCRNEIYLFEAPQGTAAGLSGNTCIVIGGTYKGVTSWYRADFATTTNHTITYLPILRNHVYTLNITRIAGPGKDTPQAAFNSAPVNIQAEIIAWDEGEMNEIIWNEHNELSVNKSLFEFHATGAPQSLFVYTDYPEGWKIVKTPTWIKVNKTEGNAGQTIEVLIESNENNYTAQTIEEGIIVIQAGNLKKNIKVTQDNALDLEINIDPTSLSFYGSGGTKSVRITTVPEGLPLEFSVVSAGGIEGLELPAAMLTGNYYEFKVGRHNVPGDAPLTASVAVTTAETNGNKRQEIIQIIQYPYELLFKFTPWQHITYGREYPAAGSRSESLYFLAQTARAWEYQGATVPDFIPRFTGIQQPNENTAKEFYFDLDPNTGWTDRPVTLTVVTTDVNIPSYDLEFWQKYTLPFIEVIKPENSKEINFGADNTGNASAEIEFITNARWTMESSGMHYSNIVSSATPTTGGDSDNSFARIPGTVILKNKQLLSGTIGTPQAGAEVTATVKLSTSGHELAPVFETDNITLKRIIPAFFEYKSASPDASLPLSRTKASVQVSVETNDAWTLTANPIKGDPITIPAAAWAAAEETVYIQDNDSWDKRPVIVTYINQGIDRTLNYMQSGYTTTGASKDVNSVLGDGGNVTVTVNGDYPANSIKVRATLSAGTFSNGTAVLESGWLPATTTSSNATLEIPANFTAGSRDIVIEYIKDGSKPNEWTRIDPVVTQEVGYNYNVNLTTTGTLPYTGGTVRFSVQGISGGRYPPLTITAYVENTAIGSVNVAEGSASITPELTVGENGNTDRSDRTVIFKSRETVSGAERTLGQLMQDGKPNFRLPNSGRYVAKANAGQMSWAAAMGIPISYNTSYFYNSYFNPYNDMSNQNYKPNENVNTGCGAYYETPADKGKWRLPTADELVEIYNHLDEIGGTFPGYAYWTSNECNEEWVNSGTRIDAWYINMQTGFVYWNGIRKTMTAEVRCVREP